MGRATEKVIEQIIENRKTFEQFCFSLSEEQLDRPVPREHMDRTRLRGASGDPGSGDEADFQATARGEKLQEADGGRSMWTHTTKRWSQAGATGLSQRVRRGARLRTN